MSLGKWKPAARAELVTGKTFDEARSTFVKLASAPLVTVVLLICAGIMAIVAVVMFGAHRMYRREAAHQ